MQPHRDGESERNCGERRWGRDSAATGRIRNRRISGENIRWLSSARQGACKDPPAAGARPGAVGRIERKRRGVSRPPRARAIIDTGTGKEASLPQRDRASRWSKLTDQAGHHGMPVTTGDLKSRSRFPQLRRVPWDSSGEKSARAPEAGIRKPHVDAGEPVSHLAFLKRLNQGWTRVLEGRTRKRPKKTVRHRQPYYQEYELNQPLGSHGKTVGEHRE